MSKPPIVNSSIYDVNRHNANYARQVNVFSLIISRLMIKNALNANFIISLLIINHLFVLMTRDVYYFMSMLH